jgi:hypothetical protein
LVGLAWRYWPSGSKHRSGTTIHERGQHPANAIDQHVVVARQTVRRLLKAIELTSRIEADPSRLFADIVEGWSM